MQSMQRPCTAVRRPATARASGLGLRVQPGQRVRDVRVAAGGATLPRWDEIYAFLKNKGLRSVSPEDAKDMMESGDWVIVDVRPQEPFSKSHIKGSVNVPMYQALDMSSGQVFQKVLKMIAYKANGVNPVEPNPDFVAQAKKAAEGKQGVIVTCEAGGTMQPSTNFPLGKASRSLQAAYRLLAEGGSGGVLHLNRGLYGAYQADLPFNGEYKPEIGRTPSAAAEPTISVLTQARGYEVRPGDKK